MGRDLNLGLMPNYSPLKDHTFEFYMNLLVCYLNFIELVTYNSVVILSHADKLFIATQHQRINCFASTT
jgi:hypothetical protein